MTDSRNTTVTYTKDIVGDAVKTFVWRRGIVGQKRLWIAEAVMIALFLWLFMQGERGWLIGVIGMGVLLPPLVILLLWLAHHRNTVGKFHRMATHRADFTFLDDGFAVASELGAATIPWSAVTEIWERPGYWMIFTAPNQFMTLPLATVSAADRDYLRAKTSAAAWR